MKGFAEILGSLIVGLMPEPPKKASIDLDHIAMNGRLYLWSKEHRNLDDVFHPSSLSDPCMRLDVVRLMVVAKVWSYEEHGINLTVIPNPDSSLFDYILHRRFDTGTALHEMEQNKYFGAIPGKLLGRWRCTNCGVIEHQIQIRPAPCNKWVRIYEGSRLVDERKCTDLGAWEYLEVKLQHPKLGIRARIDLPILAGMERIVIADLKTLGSGRWEQLQKYGKPFPKDVTQLKIYLFLANSGNFFQYPVDEGILRYIHQGDPEVGSVHFGVARDARVETWLHEYIGTVRQLAAKGRWEVATCACDKPTQARAKRCPLSPLCFQ